MGLNDKSKAISKLKSICNDTETSPNKRIQAANELLARFGATQRAVPVVKHVICAFENYQDASLNRQNAIRTMVKELERALASAIKTREAEKDLIDEDDSDNHLETVPSPEPESSAPHDELTSPSGFDLLPPDRDDDFWDGIVSGKSRRQIVGIALGVSGFMPYTRAEAIATLAARFKCLPEMLEFHPGRDNPPWDRTWIPQVSVRGQEFYNPLNGML